MQSRATVKSAYRCDTDVLIREVLEAAHDLYARTAREACRVLVHPLDEQALIMAPIGRWGPIIGIGTDGRPRFRNMVMFHDPELLPGMARVEICDGCLSMWRACENNTRRAVDLGDQPVRPHRPRIDKPQPTRTGGPETPPSPPAPGVKRTRKASKRELERRAATADRKAAEAARKAQRARGALRESEEPNAE